MIRICLNRIDFEYDIRGLLPSFYPGEPIEKTPVLTEKIPLSPEDGPEKVLFVIYREDGLETALFSEGTLYRRPFRPSDVQDRKAYKIALKQEVYLLLQEESGKELPWGTLTGIRPTKIAMGLLEEGASDTERKICYARHRSQQDGRTDRDSSDPQLFHCQNAPSGSSNTR